MERVTPVPRVGEDGDREREAWIEHGPRGREEKHIDDNI